MIKLIRLMNFLFAISALCTAVFIVILVLHPSDWKLYGGFAFLLLLISIILLGKVNNAIKVARLIIENQILHIQPVAFKLKKHNKAIRYQPGNSIEVFISCFGILLGPKVIKFNQSEVRLRTVELGRSFITLTYGTDRRMHITKVLLSEICDSELSEITYKFQYETGVIPTVVL